MAVDWRPMAVGRRPTALGWRQTLTAVGRHMAKTAVSGRNNYLASLGGGSTLAINNNQIGGAAWLAAPRSYRSTSAFEAIRANLAVPLRMALKMRSKLGCQASNLLCSAMLNNTIIEGTWFFGGWRLCP